MSHPPHSKQPWDRGPGPHTSNYAHSNDRLTALEVTVHHTNQHHDTRITDLEVSHEDLTDIVMEQKAKWDTAAAFLGVFANPVVVKWLFGGLLFFLALGKIDLPNFIKSLIAP